MNMNPLPSLRCCVSFLTGLLGLGLLVMDDAPVIAQTMTGFKSGDRIVFFGDSLTQQGGRPNGYVTLFRQALKSNGHTDVKVINAGISGHKVPDLQKRLNKDVLKHKPTHVVIYIGINDVWHSLKGEGRGTKPEVFEAGVRELIAKISAAGAKTILCTPSVIGEKAAGTNPLDAMLEQFSAISRRVASESGASLLDLRKLFAAHLKKTNTADKERGVLTTDGVHFNDAGNLFVATQMLSAFGLPSKQLRHVVLFRFKDSTTDDQVAEIVNAFAALPSKIDSIIDFEHGTDISTENRAQGFTHCFVVTFADAAGRDAYLPHAAHQDFTTLIDGKVDKVLVFDYTATR